MNRSVTFACTFHVSGRYERVCENSSTDVLIEQLRYRV